MVHLYGVFDLIADYGLGTMAKASVVSLGYPTKLRKGGHHETCRTHCSNIISDCRFGGDSVGTAFGEEIVDIQPMFHGRGPVLTHIIEGDVHSNNTGLQVIADAVMQAYQS